MAQTAGLVQSLSPELSGAERKAIRAIAHPLRPVVHVGKGGVSATLIENADASLKAHEVIKVKVLDADALPEAAERLCGACGAQLAGVIGKMLILYRKRAQEPDRS